MLALQGRYVVVDNLLVLCHYVGRIFSILCAMTHVLAGNRKLRWSAVATDLARKTMSAHSRKVHSEVMY